MDRWSGKVALVTGASSGIGLFISEKLVNCGLIVVGCGRKLEELEKLQEKCSKGGKSGTLFPYKCELTKESEIQQMFEWIKKEMGTGVDICINNAGFTTATSLLEIPMQEVRAMLDTNVVALTLCSQLSIKSMMERNASGHIINVNSVLGHSVMGVFNFYASTKFAVTALTQGFRKELAEKGLPIKVSSISPGRTETRFLHSAFGSETAERIYSTVESLRPDEVADSVIHILATPAHVVIGDLIIEPIQPTPPGTYGKK